MVLGPAIALHARRSVKNHVNLTHMFNLMYIYIYVYNTT